MPRAVRLVMSPIGTILFPVDFSGPCSATAPFVSEMAGAFGSRVILLHVLETPDLPPGKPFQALADHRRSMAQERISGYLLAELPQAERSVRDGEASAAIVNEARSAGAGLIMMPTRGSGAVRRFLIGSVTAKVLHDASCPVWTGVHLDRAVAGSISKDPVLCAVNPAGDHRGALRWAADFVRSAKSRLIVVHAMPPLADNHRRWQAEAMQAVEDLLGSESVVADIVIHAGEPHQVVAATAERTKAALVVIGRGSAGGLSGSLKANAYSIVRSSPCPVVSV